MTQRAWFITGVSVGLGRSLAAAALARGDVVTGTVRRLDDVVGFEALAPGRATAEILDVTSEAGEVEKVVRRAHERVGHLDVVVNNAGYGLSGAVEEVSEDEIRHQLETNFFGALKVIRAALPILREQRAGHIVNVSSAAGFRGSPGMGIYNASKFALEGMSEGLRLELKPLGVRVSIVSPGQFRTRWAAGASLVHAKSPLADYAAARGMDQALDAMDGVQPGDPDRAAEAIIALVEAPEPPARLLLGSDSVAVMESKIKSLTRELDDWRELALSTDYPASST
jgi:NAD(P)-dependent dehydrogenase (short-subunit alcohol dehydrogenase family)